MSVSVESSVGRIEQNIARHVYGDPRPVRLLMVALLAGGHVLIEDVPGVGKTLLAKTLASSLSLEFSRIQCTPDLLPSDVTGVAVWDQSVNQFTFRSGPIHANLVLVDEINRATPRTQSSFLEAMEEGHVTADGETRALPAPFLLLATQNPIEFEGTFPLPEAQLDRFLLRITMGYPDHNAEAAIVDHYGAAGRQEPVKSVLGGSELDKLMALTHDIKLSTPIRDYLLALVRATRERSQVRLPASPRAGVALARAARALALVEGRTFVIPDDIKALASPVLGHRLLLSRDAMLRGQTPADIIAAILAEIPAPVETLEHDA